MKIRLEISLLIALCSSTSPAFSQEGCGGLVSGVRASAEVEVAYKSGIKILIAANEGTPANPDQAEIARAKAIQLLEFSSAQSCAKAMVELAHIRMLQAATSSMCQVSTSCGGSKAAYEESAIEYEREALLLLERSTKLGEGYFELGLLRLTQSSPYYSRAKGLDMMNLAKEQGDTRATEFLQSEHR